MNSPQFNGYFKSEVFTSNWSAPMTRKRKPYNTYTKEFKLEALRLRQESNRTASAIAIAMELGIRRNQLYKWKEQMDKKSDVPAAKKARPKKEEQTELA